MPKRTDQHSSQHRARVSRHAPFPALFASGADFDRRQKRGRQFRATALLLASVVLCAISSSAADTTIRTQPAKLVNGAPFLVTVRTPHKVASLTATWIGHELSFTFDPKTKTWFALAGTSFETAPGTYPLELRGERLPQVSSDQKFSYTKKLTLGRGNYPIRPGHLEVPQSFTAPNEAQQKEIAESKTIKDDYLNRVTAGREWSGNFGEPADAEISDVFGAQRVFNGKSQSLHLGLDFRVPTGTPVAAMNDGTVLLARPLYFEGDFIVIDHGQGLETLYLHLSEFKVKEGDVVKRGQIIGLSGGTGRATGPHLHVAVRWQGTYLDPAQLMKLNLP